MNIYMSPLPYIHIQINLIIIHTQLYPRQCNIHVYTYIYTVYMSILPYSAPAISVHDTPSIAFKASLTRVARRLRECNIACFSSIYMLYDSSPVTGGRTYI